MMAWRRLPDRVVSHSVRHPRSVLAVACLVAVLASVLAVARLEIRTSNLDLVDPALPEVARFLRFAEEFGTPNAVVVVLEGGRPEDREAAVRSLGPALRRVPGTRLVLDRLDLAPEVLEINGLDPYLASDDGTQHYLFVQPGDARTDLRFVVPLLERIESTLASADLERLGVRAGVTGVPRYAVDDREVIRSDIKRVTGWSVGAIALLLAVGLGGAVAALVLAATLAMALLWTVGVAALWPGHVTLLSAFFASIVFGIGIDFGIHALGRVRELTAGPPETRWRQAMASVAPGLLVAAVTSASGFLALGASGFRGFEELGWIAGVGVLLSLVSAFTVLPAAGCLLDLAGRRWARAVAPVRAQASTAGRWGAAPLRALAVALPLGLAVLAPFVRGPGFDGDYSHLQPAGSETVRLERSMVERSGLSPQFAAFVVPTDEAAEQLSERLLGEPVVGDVRSVADFADLVDGAGGPVPIPAVLRPALIAEDGRRVVYAYPASDAWSESGGAAFVERMQEIDPEVTGMPVLGRFMVARTRSALRRCLVVAAAAVGLALLVGFGRPLPALLAGLPALLTLLSLETVMAWSGLPWNPISVMALPVVLGVAVDDGVHLVRRVEEEGSVGVALRTTGRSVVLTSLTTIAGFGGLLASRHRGLVSFATVLVLGVSLALVHSLLVLPGVLSLLPPGRRRAHA